MTTVALLRTTYLNAYLQRAEASVLPWTDATCNTAIGDALTKLWPRYGTFTFGDVASSSGSMLYTVPAAFSTKFRISRIDLIQTSSGMYVDRITNWRIHSPTQVLVKPLLATGLTLRFYGWVPFSAVGTDLPTELETTVAQRAASRCYGMLAAALINSERQQNLDSGRVVSYQDAVGLAAYFERLFADGISDHPSLVSYGPRLASRS